MDWELFDGEKQHGPYTEQAVIEAIGRGLKPTTKIRPVGKEKWKELHAHVPFAAALEKNKANDGSPPAVRLPSSPSLPGDEIVFMKQDEVLITNKRAVLRGIIYPLANITSVRMHKQSPTKALMVLGLACVCFGALLAWSSDFSSEFGNTILLIGLLLEATHLVVMKPMYWVRIATASGESNAMGYPKPSEANGVVQALSDAIVSRGA